MAEFVSSNNSHTEERFLVFDEQGFLVGSFSSLAEVYDYRKAAREDEDLNNRGRALSPPPHDSEAHALLG